MVLEMDLTKYCRQAVIEKGQELYNKYGISGQTSQQTAEGGWCLKGKSIDSFNFVHHPRLTVDNTGRQLLNYSCDCSDIRKESGMCEHCASLCLAWNGGVVYALAQELEPLPEPEPMVAKPVEEPVEEPCREIIEEPVAEAVEEPAEEYIEEPAVEASEEPDEEHIEDLVEEVAEESAEESVPEPAQHRTMQVQFGHLAEEGTPVYWCPNDTEQVFHTNVGIIGTMGTGKTQFAKSLLTQLYMQRNNNYDGSPLGILVFDYKGDYNETKPDFVKAANVRVLKPYRLPYNPLALNPGMSFKPLLPMHTANEFKDTISQIYGLGPKQEQLLLDCIVKAYAKQGIEPANPATWGRTAPTIEQVYQIFADETFGRPADKLTAAMNKLHQFCLFEGDPRRAISLEELLNGIVVVDMAGYDSDIQSTIVAITLNQFYAQMHKMGSSSTDGRYRQLRKFILVDEADTFMSQDFPSLRKIMKEGREFGVGVILSTQSLTHFVSGEDDYSRYVLTWIVHNVSDLKQRDVEYVFKLQPKSEQILRDYAAIKGLKKHYSMVKLGNEQPRIIANKAFYQLCQELQG